MNKSVVILVAFLALVVTCFAAKCENQCLVKGDVCCNGRLLTAKTTCSCSIAAGGSQYIDQKPPTSGDDSGSITARQQEREPSLFYEGELKAMNDVLTATGRQPEKQCALSCRQVCVDCANDAKITHNLKRTSVDNDRCLSMQDFAKLRRAVQKRLLKSAHAKCAKVCDKCNAPSAYATKLLSSRRQSL